MATGTVLNEFVAFRTLAGMPAAAFGPQAQGVLTYALCGVARFASLGTLIGGLRVMVPERRAEVVGLGVRSVLAGTIATCMSGALAGWLVWEGALRSGPADLKLIST